MTTRSEDMLELARLESEFDTIRDRVDVADEHELDALADETASIGERIIDLRNQLGLPDPYTPIPGWEERAYARWPEARAMREAWEAGRRWSRWILAAAVAVAAIGASIYLATLIQN